jgi:glycine/D-amino acid oxidase-like deaminating enzyme
LRLHSRYDDRVATDETWIDMPQPFDRRRVLAAAGSTLFLGGLQGCGIRLRREAPVQPSVLQLPPVRASVDRITRITVCTRPFRAQGPRIDLERVGQKNVVHNYGHGGSGWSLSWGSSGMAVELALATGERNIGVVGCGALGLTSASLLQRAGIHTTIYAKELPPNVRSSWASGLWTPDSRICLEENATPAFKQTWQTMARDSYRTYQTLLGLPGTPVEFIDSYLVADTEDLRRRHQDPADPRPKFAELQRELLDDLIPNPRDFGPGTHPFGNRYVRRGTTMMFNLTSYSHLLLSDFLAGGGKIEIVEFHSPGDLAALPERTLINATGYGARALFNDASITPVRGQVARGIPQPEVGYGLFYQGVSYVPRRDGPVFQVVGDSDYVGFGDESTNPDRAEAELAVATIAKLFPPA